MASIKFSLPSPALFRFPPVAGPLPIAPPSPSSFSLSAPAGIPQDLFARALDIRVPLTISIVYAVAAKSLNAYNRRRRAKAGGKAQPWGVAKTRVFSWFVVAHNILLAVYSAWTFWGMLRGMMRSVAAPDWSLSATHQTGGFGAAWVPTVDSLCRMHGSAGLGAAAQWDENLQGWEHLSLVSVSPAAGIGGAAGSAAANASTVFAGPPALGAAPGAEPGRLWNEGLAFYGWIFYLSKFYEVIDTLIILAKGKTGSILQTYHHAGAMFAMWAGIRFMSAPVWMFVLFNSFIHALMYTYYTLTAFSIPVPVIVKRTLTTMQITQFLVGVTFAISYSFISYTVPVAVSRAASSVSVRDISSTAAGVAAATASATAGGALSKLKGILSSAAVDNSAIANVVVAAPASESVASAAHGTLLATRPCITTNGATLAIWLNIFYLIPLIYLFVNFFVTSYLRRTAAGPAEKHSKKGVDRGDAAINAAVADAAKGLERKSL